MGYFFASSMALLVLNHPIYFTAGILLILCGSQQMNGRYDGFGVASVWAMIWCALYVGRILFPDINGTIFQWIEMLSQLVCWHFVLKGINGMEQIYGNLEAYSLRVAYWVQAVVMVLDRILHQVNNPIQVVWYALLLLMIWRTVLLAIGWQRYQTRVQQLDILQAEEQIEQE